MQAASPAIPHSSLQLRKKFPNHNSNVNHHPRIIIRGFKRPAAVSAVAVSDGCIGGGGWECKTNESSIHETCKLLVANVVLRQLSREISQRWHFGNKHWTPVHFGTPSGARRSNPRAWFSILFGAFGAELWFRKQWSIGKTRQRFSFRQDVQDHGKITNNILQPKQLAF